MRENRTYGSEGGEGASPSRPLSFFLPVKSAWMLVAGFSFALMGVFVKLAAEWFSSDELVFYRSVLGLILVLALVGWRHGLAGGRQLLGAHVGLHLRRSLVGFAALTAFFYSLTKLSLAAALTLNYTSPLFLALIMPLALKERPSRAQYFAVALGFAGVALLLRPWETGGDLGAGLVGLLSGLLAALAYVHVRQLGLRQEPEWRTVFWFAAVCSAGSAALASAHEWHPVGLDNAGLLLALGVFATAGQLAMTRAYRRGETAVVAALAYSTVVFGSLLDVVIWNEPLPAPAWAGILLTVTAGLWAVRLVNVNPRSDPVSPSVPPGGGTRPG